MFMIHQMKLINKMRNIKKRNDKKGSKINEIDNKYKTLSSQLDSIKAPDELKQFFNDFIINN